MSISDIKGKKSTKTVFVYLAVSLFAIAVNSIYSLFGHGEKSGYMTWMFLYPLIGGTMLFLFTDWVRPELKQLEGYRIFYNLYNSGIAMLTVGSFMKGIFEIAGTNSRYIPVYYTAGILFILAGLVSLLYHSVKKSSTH